MRKSVPRKLEADSSNIVPADVQALLIDVTPTGRGQSDRPNAAALNNQGVNLVKDHKVERALSKFDASINADPTLFEPYFNRGVLFLYLERFVEAALSLQAVARLKPSFRQVHTTMKTVSERAAERFVQHATLGIFLVEQDKPDDALVPLEKAIGIERGLEKTLARQWLPHARDIMRGQTHFAHAAALEALNRPGEAIEALRAALAVQPNEAEWHYELAKLLARKGEIGEAVAQFRKALEIQPDIVQAIELIDQLEVAISESKAAMEDGNIIRYTHLLIKHNADKTGTPASSDRDMITTTKVLELLDVPNGSHGTLIPYMTLMLSSLGVRHVTDVLPDDQALLDRILNTSKLILEYEAQKHAFMQSGSEKDRITAARGISRAFSAIKKSDPAIAALLDDGTLKVAQRTYRAHYRQAKLTA